MKHLPLVLLFCALLFIWAPGITLAQDAPVADEGTAVPSATAPAPAPTPTRDRLAAPPTVLSPTQADDGAQLYWLWCQPCHGDQGQGLTDEWRAQYPPEDQNCWNSGCHGNNPYESGFTLPKTVPPVSGEESLTRFQTLGELYRYIRHSMPYEYPGTLKDEEYLAITAHLARQHGVWDGTTLNSSNVEQMNLRAALTSAVPATAEAPGQPQASNASIAVDSGQSWWIAILFLTIFGVGGLSLWLWHNR